jgi:hypothetical protein
LTKLERRGLIIRETDRLCIPDLYALEEVIT